MNPQSGVALDPIYYSATAAEVDEAVQLASQAFAAYSKPAARRAPPSCAVPRMSLSFTVMHWRSAHTSKPRCPCRVCLAK